jgi:hypothetical protein
MSFSFSVPIVPDDLVSAMAAYVYVLRVAQVQNPAMASDGKMSALLFLRTSYPIPHVQSEDAVVMRNSRQPAHSWP